MNKNCIAVTSRSFSKNLVLRGELKKKYPEARIKFNDKGEKLVGSVLVEYLYGYSKAIIGLEKIDEHIFREIPTLTQKQTRGSNNYTKQ